ncbi:MAG: thioredoxin domain-containing protein [Mariprofundus sp.]|nr:thioredoxin domain-containing protein [Mariprofundus sp.]
MLNKEKPVLSNELIHESSPYLLQHAHNPVHWFPWGEQAFALARMQNKPIFLSIGYSTCHWCHVMEHESFEDPAVAKVLNQYFIAIKVDREERPDIDALYMQAAQMMNGSGGWPLNLLLTSDKKPFYATTYLPKEGRFGQIGLIELANRVGLMWQQDRQRIESSADAISLAVTNAMQIQPSTQIDGALIDRAYRELAQSFDIKNGGFGGAPLFPSPHRLLFLLRYGLLKHRPEALTMVTKSLSAMQRGGIHDQLGGGFHRYSTDAQWFLPHFEKMLSDQAMLLMAYSEGYQASGNSSFADTARDIADYLLRDMHDSLGGFYTAEDADSEAEEGRFYLWSSDEIRHILGKRAAPFMQAYGVQEDGNFKLKHAKNGANILYQPARVDRETFAQDRAKLLNQRNQRIRPFRDDKILTDWNGLTIAALAISGRVLHQPRYTHAAVAAATFILQHLRKDNGELLHRWRMGKAGIDGQLEDYSSMVWGLSELYQTSLDAHWLQQALALNNIMLEKFQSKHGGFYQTAANSKLLTRPMQSFDGALPSGNSIAMHNLLRLSRLTANASLEKEAAAIADHFSTVAQRAPLGSLHLLSALLLAESPSKEVVLAGERESPSAVAMLKLIQAAYRPNTVLLWHDKATEKLAPFTRGQKPIGKKVTTYICENNHCNQPTDDLKVAAQLLKLHPTR